MANLAFGMPQQGTAWLDKGGSVTRVWWNWLATVWRAVQACAQMVQTLTVAAQVASIGATALVAVATGLYRVSWTAQVTTPASVSSSLIVTVNYTQNGLSCSQSSAAMTSNLGTAPASGSFLVQCDPITPLTYSTTYASVGTPMAYGLLLVAETMSA